MFDYPVHKANIFNKIIIECKQKINIVTLGI
jgi:hypothetical protein